MCAGLISLMVSSFPITSRPPRPKCLLSEIKNLLVFFFCVLVYFGRIAEEEGGVGGLRDAEAGAVGRGASPRPCPPARLSQLQL